MGLDKRIGHSFLNAGIGYGGSCFPKDVKALAYMANVQGRHPQLLHAVMDINDFQRKTVVLKTRDTLGDDLTGRKVGLLGLAFKPNTDDMREAPSIDIARMLRQAGAAIKGYDPVSMEWAGRVMPDMQLARDAYELVADCDAVIVCTEWNEFKQLDLRRVKSLMKHPVIVDGRNIYDPDLLREMGFTYLGVGRGYRSAEE
jgi:UDPglucose 6-dehydrogenase